MRIHDKNGDRLYHILVMIWAGACLGLYIYSCGPSEIKTPPEITTTIIKLDSARTADHLPATPTNDSNLREIKVK